MALAVAWRSPVAVNVTDWINAVYLRRLHLETRVKPLPVGGLREVMAKSPAEASLSNYKELSF
jgi:hypothetical protein